MSEQNPVAENGALLTALQSLLGDSHVLSDEQNRVLYSQDVFSQSTVAGLVIQPSSTEQLSEAVRLITDQGIALVPRGGGMSYTSGYVPQSEHSVMVDSSRMNRVLEINREDMYVTVEAGCSWQALHEALQGTGLRTPYWGTLSGRFATVGGSVSQNSIFWGSGQFGSAVESVLSMDVVLADGSVISTGSAAQNKSSPFFRHFGPDLTGLFCGDCGALGIKATVTLRLIPELGEKRFLSLEFTDFASQSRYMSEVSRRGLAMECFGFDPFLQAQRMQRESLASDVKALAGVMKSAGGVGKAIKSAAKIAVAGRRFMDGVQWSLHLMIEERCKEAADQILQQARQLASQMGGEELEDSIPSILRANPFGPVNNMVGPAGERWVPVHAVVPHSKVQAAYQLVEQVLETHRADIEKFDIGVGYLLATVAHNGFVIEPVFFWPDELKALHKASLTKDHLARLKGFEENLPAREAVTKIRKALVTGFSELGAVHLQIGKAYRYRDGISEQAFSLLSAAKKQLDPKGLINPGALGLENEKVMNETAP